MSNCKTERERAQIYLRYFHRQMMPFQKTVVIFAECDGDEDRGLKPKPVMDFDEVGPAQSVRLIASLASQTARLNSPSSRSSAS